MAPWPVALAITFVFGFLFTVAFEAWRNTRKAPVAQSIQAAASKSFGDRVFPVGGRSPRSETGSWVLATAGFMLIAFPQTDLLPYVPLGLSPARFILFAGAGAWVLTRVLGQRSRYRIAVLGPVLGVYATAVMLAYAAQMTRPTAAPNIDSIFAVQLLLVVVVLFCFTVIHGYLGLMRVIKGLVAGAVVSAVLALQTSLTGSDAGPQLRLPGLVNGAGIPFTVDDVYRGGMVRAQGSASHPLELACVLTVIFPLALAVTLSLRAAGKRWWPWAVATAVIVGGIAVTLSRSGTVGVCVGLAVMACYWPVRRTLGVLALAGGVVSIGLLLQVPFLTSYLSIFTADSSVAQRAAVTSALPFDVSPFGVFGRATGATSPGAQVPTLDDQYLKVLSEMGVVGLLAYLMLVVTTLVLAFLAFRNARSRVSTHLPGPSAHLFLGIAASFAAYAVVSIFLDTAGFLQIWTLMWLLIALSAVAYRISCVPQGTLPGADGARHDLIEVGEPARS